MTDILVQQSSKKPFLYRVTHKIHKEIWRLFFGRKLGQLGGNSFIHKPMLLSGLQNIYLQDNVYIWPNSRIEAIETNIGSGKISIGCGTKINPNVHIAAASRVSIGSNCLFASNVYITDHDHFWDPEHETPTESQSLIASPVIIGDNVWLGEGAKVLKGVTIGKGAIIGASALVTKDVPSNAIAVGVPAKIIDIRN